MFEPGDPRRRPECAAAMRVAGGEPQQLLLPAMSRKRPEPAFDAPTRRVAFAASGVRASAPDGTVAAGRSAGQREAGGAVDEGDGPGGDLFQARHQPDP